MWELVTVSYLEREQLLQFIDDDRVRLDLTLLLLFLQPSTILHSPAHITHHGSHITGHACSFSSVGNGLGFIAYSYNYWLFGTGEALWYWGAVSGRRGQNPGRLRRRHRVKRVSDSCIETGWERKVGKF